MSTANKKNFTLARVRRDAGRTDKVSTEEQIDQFIAGAEPITTFTFQLPIRLHKWLKMHATETSQSVREILVRLLEDYRQAQ